MWILRQQLNTADINNGKALYMYVNFTAQECSQRDFIRINHNFSHIFQILKVEVNLILLDIAEHPIINLECSKTLQATFVLKCH